jgi:hypothetical protein
LPAKLKLGQVILLLAICVVAYIELTRDEEKRVGEGPKPDFSNGFPGAQNQGFCSNPLATNWNPLAPENNSEAEMVVTCAGLPEIIAYNDYLSGMEESIEQQADRMAYQLSLCTTDLTGQTAVARYGSSYPDGNPVTGGDFDTLSYCMPGEWLLTQITQQALMVAPEGTFQDGLQSASSYEVHRFVNLPNNLSSLGEVDRGDVVSIYKLRPDSTYEIQDLIDYIYTPNLANKSGIQPQGFIHAHPSHEQFVERLQTWKDAPMSSAFSGKYRRAGDPRYHHPVDFDIDNSGLAINPSNLTIPGGLGNASVEKNIMRQFFDYPYSGPKAKEDVPQHLHKIFDILDTDSDGIVGIEDFLEYVKTTSLGQRKDGVQDNLVENLPIAPGDQATAVSGYNQHYRGVDPGPSQIVTTDGFEDINEGQFSEQFFHSVYTSDLLEQCYSLRMPLWPGIEDGTSYNPSRGCTELFGVPGEHEGLEGELDGPIMSLVQLNKEKWVEVLYATDGMACGNEEGEVLCFPFSRDEKLAAAEEYLEVIRPMLGLDTDPEIRWDTKEIISWPDPNELNPIVYRFQEGATLGAEIASNVLPANDEVYRAKIKSNTQCPASHPNFHRFCLTRRTLPSLIGPPGQIAPVYGVDETTETT